jgi:hypothetical protein
MERMTTMRRLALIVCAGASLCVRGGQSIEATAAFGSEQGMTMTHTSLASGQVIRTWNEICRSQAFGNNLRNARQLAIMHTAMHDAVNGVEALALVASRIWPTCTGWHDLTRALTPSSTRTPDSAGCEPRKIEP